ncbi:MAG: thioredoxin family protein [Christensenellaceae bacterium]
MIHAGENDLKALTAEGFFIVDFYTDTCGPCKILAPILARVESELPFIDVVKVNLSEYPAYGEEYCVHGVPTLLYVKDGVICERTLGVKTGEEIKATVAKHLYGDED